MSQVVLFSAARGLFSGGSDVLSRCQLNHGTVGANAVT